MANRGTCTVHAFGGKRMIKLKVGRYYRVVIVRTCGFGTGAVGRFWENYGCAIRVDRIVEGRNALGGRVYTVYGTLPKHFESEVEHQFDTDGIGWHREFEPFSTEITEKTRWV